MIEDIVKNLVKGKQVVENLTQQQYENKTLAPYFSSIGTHIRHVLDMFNCVFIGIANQQIDLTKRDRSLPVETDPNCGIAYFNLTIEKVLSLDRLTLQKPVELIDDFGSGKKVVQSTLGAVLAQTHSHAIHHYAIMGYIIHHLGVYLPDDEFGVNPTTPKQKSIKVNR